MDTKLTIAELGIRGQASRQQTDRQIPYSLTLSCLGPKATWLVMPSNVGRVVHAHRQRDNTDTYTDRQVCITHLRLVETKVFRTGNGSLGGWG